MSSGSIAECPRQLSTDSEAISANTKAVSPRAEQPVPQCGVRPSARALVIRYLETVPLSQDSAYTLVPPPQLPLAQHIVVPALICTTAHAIATGAQQRRLSGSAREHG